MQQSYWTLFGAHGPSQSKVIGYPWECGVFRGRWGAGKARVLLTHPLVKNTFPEPNAWLQLGSTHGDRAIQ